MTSKTTAQNITEDGKAAVDAVTGRVDGVTFDGNYSNADVRAIVEAFEASGHTPSHVWVCGLRRGWK